MSSVSKWSLSFLLGSLLFACKPATQLQVVKPALISLPDHVQVIAIVDRSRPSSGFVDAIEGSATGEDINQDPSGRRMALDALANTLTRTPRFELIHTGLEYTGSETGSTFATPLPWSEIKRICDDFDADAVLAIEKFDSNTERKSSLRKTKYKDDDGKEKEKTVYDASINVDVHLGWRIYDLQSQTILDEVDVTDSGSDSESGAKTKIAALEQLGSAISITEQVSQRAGKKYAERIAPIMVTVSRTFYKKAKGPYEEQMAKAARFFETDNWDGAVDIWENILDSPNANSDVKGLASYNMAVAFEKRGLLTTALEWAQKSYGEYGNKKGRNYVDIIKRRLDDIEILQEQLKDRT